jgi:hypothetical protein
VFRDQVLELRTLPGTLSARISALFLSRRNRYGASVNADRIEPRVLVENSHTLLVDQFA